MRSVQGSIHARGSTASGSINGVGSHEIGSGFNSRRRKPAGFNSIGIRSHEIGSGFNSRKGAMFRKPSTTLFHASWLSFEALHHS